MLNQENRSENQQKNQLSNEKTLAEIDVSRNDLFKTLPKCNFDIDKVNEIVSNSNNPFFEKIKPVVQGLVETRDAFQTNAKALTNLDEKVANFNALYESNKSYINSNLDINNIPEVREVYNQLIESLASLRESQLSLRTQFEEKQADLNKQAKAECESVSNAKAAILQTLNFEAGEKQERTVYEINFPTATAKDKAEQAREKIVSVKSVTIERALRKIDGVELEQGMAEAVSKISDTEYHGIKFNYGGLGWTAWVANAYGQATYITPDSSKVASRINAGNAVTKNEIRKESLSKNWNIEKFDISDDVKELALERDEKPTESVESALVYVEHYQKLQDVIDTIAEDFKEQIEKKLKSNE